MFGKKRLLCGVLTALMFCGALTLRAGESYMAKLRAGVEKNDAEAQFEMGFYYLFGAVLKPDKDKGLQLIQKAADQGMPVARAVLSGGKSTDKELCKLAEQGDVWAQNVLGMFLTTYDYHAAAPMFRMAAEKGNAFAQCALGTCYAEGEGVERDFAQAAIWFRKAAEQGHPYGQLALGSCYCHGHGVEKDEKQAAIWFHKAAEQGYEPAKAALKTPGK